MTQVDSHDETTESHQSNKNIPVPKENNNFVQVSRAYLKDIRELTRKNPLSSEILLYLVEHMGRTSNAVVCSYKVLQEVTGTSRATVGRAIKVLKDGNWVEAVKVGNATAYGVNARVFWQAARNQKKYAVFQATVVAGASEQDNDFVEKSKHSLKHIPFIGDDERVSVHNDDGSLKDPDQLDMELS